MTNVSERIKTVITRSKQEPTLKVGDNVRNKDSGELGVIRKSRFGVKVKGTDAGGKRWKTNGYSAEYVARYWEVVDDVYIGLVR